VRGYDLPLSANESVTLAVPSFEVIFTGEQPCNAEKNFNGDNSLSAVV
jgi:hypothetical protein